MKKEFLAAALFGVAVLLILKYVVFGLKNWNSTFHPERQDDPSGIFYCPLFRLLGPCAEKVSHQIILTDIEQPL